MPTTPSPAETSGDQETRLRNSARVRESAPVFVRSSGTPSAAFLPNSAEGCDQTTVAAEEHQTPT